jgi:prepilin-type N-terminal cleavage/methylation domain-containing protein
MFSKKLNGKCELKKRFFGAIIFGKLDMNKRKGFTLIELLVVIAIIALLLSIVMPALRKVKESAKSLQCQTNLRGLVAAWYTYSTDNDEQLCGSWNYHPTMEWGNTWDWAWSPWDPQTNQPTWTGVTYNAPLIEREEGIKKGTLFPYVDTCDSYHCPSDKSAGGNFRSYSMPDCLNGIWGSWAPWENLKKISQIRSPGDKYVFLEENDSRGCYEAIRQRL